MTDSSPCTRICQGCGCRFVIDSDDQRYCSALCAGQVPIGTLLVMAQRAAAAARRQA